MNRSEITATCARFAGGWVDGFRVFWHRQRSAVSCYLRFCLVGGSGVFVDSLALWMLHQWAGVDLVLAKIAAAEVALVSNFILNDRWTFADCRRQGVCRFCRFCRFQLICLCGIGVSVATLYGLREWFGVPLLGANLCAIFLASIWNYVVSARFGWHATGENTVPAKEAGAGVPGRQPLAEDARLRGQQH